MTYLVRWYEDEGCHIWHSKVCRDEAEAEAVAEYLQGKVFRLTVTPLGEEA